MPMVLRTRSMPQSINKFHPVDFPVRRRSPTFLSKQGCRGLSGTRSRSQRTPRSALGMRSPATTRMSKRGRSTGGARSQPRVKLVLAGITDRASRRTGHPVRDLASVLEGAPKGAPIILLDHQPSDARHAAKLGVALQLSGHTHGGLILGIDRLAARANAGYGSVAPPN